jgi:hypothetical protein
MTRELLIGAAAVVILSPSALAQPAGAATGITPPATGVTAPGVTGPTDTSVGAQINSTLQAGQIPPSGQIAGSHSATVGGASTGQGLRRPNPSTGTYGGLSTPAYVPPGATPYTGPAGAAGSAASPTTGPSGGAQGR